MCKFVADLQCKCRLMWIMNYIFKFHQIQVLFCVSGQEESAQFFANNGLHVVASLPCYSAKNVNTQRGSGVFDRSIHALLMLNELGYGKPETGLQLDLVYNPLGKVTYIPTVRSCYSSQGKVTDRTAVKFCV